MFWLFVGAPALAGDVDIRAFGSGRPVADVRLLAMGREWRTGPDGRASIDLPEGTAVTALSEDFKTAAFDLAAGTTIVRLHPYPVEEVVVREMEAPRESEREVLTIEELKRIPGGFGDPVRGLQSLPSVARPQTVEGTLVVRGAEGFATRTTLDGMEVPFLYHLMVGKSVIEPTSIADIEFFPGSVPSRFGDVGAAVVNIRTTDERPQRGFHGKAHVDLLEFGASSTLRLPHDWELMMSGRASWVGTLVRAGQLALHQVRKRDDFEPAGIRVPYSDLQLRLRKRFGTDHRFEALVLGASDGIRVIPGRYDVDGDGDLDPSPPVPEGEPDLDHVIRTEFVRAKLGWKTETERFTSDTWMATGLDRRHNFQSALARISNTPAMVSIDTQIARFRTVNEVRLGAVELQAGADARWRRENAKDWAVDKAYSRDTLWLGPFADAQVSMGPVTITPGVRAAVHPTVKRDTLPLEPRVSLSVSLADGLRVFAYAGRMSQLTTLEMSQAANASDAPTLMETDQLSAGVHYRTGVWDLKLTAYHSSFSNLLVRRDVPVRVQRWLELQPVNAIETGTAYGAELLVRRQMSDRWFGWFAVSAGRSFRDGDTDGRYRSDHDLPIDTTVMLAREMKKGWGASLRARVGSGRVFTPLHGVYSAEADRYYGVQGARNSERFPLFHQFDIRLDKTWTRPRTTWTAYLDLFNATNAANPIGVHYNWDYSERRTVTFIPVLPALGAEVSF